MSEAPVGTASPGQRWSEQLAAGIVEIARCRPNAHAFFPPMPGCPNCGSAAVELVASSGAGRIYSWVVVHRTLAASFADQTPYGIVAVDLDEGARVFGRWLGRLDELAADIQVTACPYPADGQTALGFRWKDAA